MTQTGDDFYQYTHQLIQSLKNEDWNVRRFAEDALCEVGEPVVPALIDALEDKNIQYGAVKVLAKIGDPRAFPVLLYALDDDRQEVRANAAKALGDIGNPKAMSALKDLSKGEKSVQVRKVVKESLDKLSFLPTREGFSSYKGEKLERARRYEEAIQHYKRLGLDKEAMIAEKRALESINIQYHGDPEDLELPPIKTLLKAAGGDSIKLNELLRLEKGVFSDPVVQEACRDALKQQHNLGIVDSIIRNSNIEYEKVINVFEVVAKKRKPHTRAKALQAQLEDLNKSLKGFQKEIQGTQNSIREIFTVPKRVDALEAVSKAHLKGAQEISMLLAEYRRLQKEIESYRDLFRDLEEMESLYKEVELK